MNISVVSTVPGVMVLMAIECFIVSESEWKPSVSKPASLVAQSNDVSSGVVLLKFFLCRLKQE